MLAFILRRLVKSGTLTVIRDNGQSFRVGDGTAPQVKIRVNRKVERSLLFRSPSLTIGEAYMDGDLIVEEGTIYDFLYLATANMSQGAEVWGARIRRSIGLLFRRAMQYNPATRSRRNVAHHYDLSDTLYDLFLDKDRQYSCAYFRSPEDDIDTAQEQKKQHIAAKLLIRPGDRILDIGSGWGGLALYLASMTEGDVTGCTLSTEQHQVSQRRAVENGVSERVRFELRDYRALDTEFDRIVSVGMFEHVGVGHYDQFFGKVRNLLKEDGVCLIHTIGRADGPGVTDPWVRKYIFPGGYVPALSEVMPAIERQGLFTTDIEILRLHYAETLKAWRARFMAAWDEVARLYDERFCRMWEFYLAGSEVAFRNMGLVVFQIQLAKQQDAVPLTRDYIVDWERTHSASPSKSRAAAA
ncbi:MAG: SAM-dependent methyltransferase [Rhodospirillaceae bacterium]|nr:SAM-dependent methyltransferase [Rhodospirillaceae bacterium]